LDGCSIHALNLKTSYDHAISSYSESVLLMACRMVRSASRIFWKLNA
jgi:hypothetical protein